MIASASRLLTAVCALAGSAAALTALEVKGKDFVNSKTGDRFQIIGVDYQPGGEAAYTGKKDPLSQPDACLRDAALMQRLGVNTIRVYNLAPNLNHDECVSIFNAAGIYMILDVNSPFSTGSLNRAEPWTSYDAEYYGQVFGVIEAFKNFDNVLGFFAGNEVINQDAAYSAPAYVRAVIRDMKDYIAKNSKRAIPVGYSAADVRDILMDTERYFECQLSNSTTSRADFFGLNSYSWCGDATYTSSGYNVLTEDFSNATIPVFFSEYGCNNVKPRTFTEVQALYGEDMTQAFSGGLVYEWTEEDNQYGLIKVNSDGSVTLRTDYDNLKTQFSKIDMSRIESSNTSQSSIKAETCSPSLITESTFYNAWDLPKAPSKVSDYISSGLPSASTGALTSVTATSFTQSVTDANGSKVTGVTLKIMSGDESNSPSSSSSNSTSSSSSASGSAASVTHSGAASFNVPSLAAGGISGLFMLLASLL
ncbi:1-3-beta-glucanosyltransferase gel2 [Penicillium hispanicum]|uniref:1-3-beta-glucanosyltransferase gel2 n=1 Tax=Penicillium hispanicum TaxID=1080232 RepID=UPI002540F03B|nr:1-3-beta-glucanosyltransferase gel2 [Penicillium hispanicum]KAJ5584818.1 1-3-beta-glucanosyltransferase gel2 [Penicillium hispanicum]